MNENIPGWEGPYYKILAESELGNAGHTSGIVVSQDTSNFFLGMGKLPDGEHNIEIVVEFHDFEDIKHLDINIHVFENKKTHNHMHITGGKFMTTYRNAGAKSGDVLLFWKSSYEQNKFKLLLIKQESKYWKEINTKINKRGGGFLTLSEGFLKNYVAESDIVQYQSESIIDDNLKESDFPTITTKQIKPISTSKNTLYRSKSKGDFVIKKSNYCCEVNSNHMTFISRITNKNYVEKHHLIPMKYYEDFDNYLDDISNIISLCPICHRLLHHGTPDKIKNILEILYKNKEKELKNKGFIISFEELNSKY